MTARETRSRTSPVWACAILAAAAVAAATSHGARAAGDGAPPTAPLVVDCDSRSQVIPGRPLTARSLRRDAVAVRGGLFVFARYLADAPRHEFTPRAGRMRGLKTPIIVPAGPPVTMALQAKSIGKADIDVGLDRPGRLRGDVVEFRPCPRDAEVAGNRVGRYTPFVGGFRVTGPQCLRFTVAAEGAAAKRDRLALGRSCR